MDGTEAQQILAAFDRIAGRLERAQSKSNSSIHVHAGGAAVWMVTLIAGLMFAINVMIAIAYVSHDRKIDNLYDYVTATYMIAPSLAEKVPPPNDRAKGEVQPKVDAGN